MSEFCHSCAGNNGTLATVPGMGPYVFCTSCRSALAPEGWYIPCKRCGKGVYSHVPFGVPGREENTCQGYVPHTEDR